MNNLCRLLFAKDEYQSEDQSVISVEMLNKYNACDLDNIGYLSEQDVTAMAESMKCGCDEDALKRLWNRFSSTGVNQNDMKGRFCVMQDFTELHKVCLVEAALHKRGKVEASSVQMLLDEPEATTLSRKQMVEVLKSLGHEVQKDMLKLMCKKFCIPEEKIPVPRFKMVESRWEKFTTVAEIKKEEEEEVQRRTVRAA